MNFRTDNFVENRNVKSARIEFKTTVDFKDTIRQAAECVGLDVSSFIIETVLKKANKVLENQRSRYLSDQGWEKINKLLSNPPAPTIALKDLIERNNHGTNK